MLGKLLAMLIDSAGTVDCGVFRGARAGVPARAAALLQRGTGRTTLQALSALALGRAIANVASRPA